MTNLFSNTPDSRVSILKSSDFATVWYKLIELIGLPVDTEGVIIDSIEAAIANQGDNGVACFTTQSSNYRTNKVWYTLKTAV